MPYLLHRDEAEALTSPYHNAYINAHEGAWKQWLEGIEKMPLAFKDLNSRDRHSMLNTWITKAVDRDIGGLWLKTGGPEILVHQLTDRAVVRFKYLNGEDLRPTTYPTEQQLHLSEQVYTPKLWHQLELEGFTSPPTLLTCGYTLKPTEDAISQIVVVCHAPEFRFYYDLRDGAGGAEIVELPGIPPLAPRVVSDIADRERTSEQ